MAASGDELARTEMSFGEHLEELRRRLFKALLASLGGLVLVFARHEQVLAIVTAPFREVMIGLGRSPALNTFSVQGAFFVSVKVSFIVGLILTAPIWIYQIWAFIAAGLYEKERRVVYRFVPLCLVLFIAGVLFGYFVLVPIGLEYLLAFADPTVIQNTVGVSEYLSLFVLLTLVLGLAFQMPVVMVGLARAGIMSPAGFRSKRRWTILLLFIFAAIVTPPDPVTQILLALPLIVLYELGIAMAWFGMGASRPQIDWKATLKALRKPAIGLLLLFLLREPILSLWRAESIGARHQDLSQDAGAGEAFARILGEPVTASFIVQVQGATESIVVLGKERAALLEVSRISKTWIPLDADQDLPGGPVWRYTINEAGLRVAAIRRPKDTALASLWPGLSEGWRAGSSEAAAVCRSALARWLEPHLGRSLGEDADTECAAIAEWLLAHPKALLAQDATTSVILPEGRP